MPHFDAIKALLGNSSTYYLIAVDMDSNYSYLNKRYAQVFETIHGNLIGTHYAKTIHPDDQQVCLNVSKMAFTNPDAVFPATLRKLDAQGGFIITKWEYKAMIDDDGTPRGIFCIGHDITELLQLSGELQEIKNSHSHLVRRHVANLSGLGKLVNNAESPEDVHSVAKMIVQSASELDAVIKSMYS